MAIMKDLAQLGKLVAAQHGWPAAKAFKAYAMDEADRAVLTKCAVDLLAVFPPLPGAGALLSAALAVALESRMAAPIQVVAGTLAVEGAAVFGDRQPFDGRAVFDTPKPEWGGHVWVMVGPYVVDAAIFRIAYSSDGPAVLSRHVDLTFGPNKGLYVDMWRRTAQQGLSYEPQYVLGAEQVTRLMREAYHAIRQARGD